MSTPRFLTLPGTVRSRRLATGRGRFAVLQSAPPVGGPALGTALLVPGFTGSKEDFIALVEPLARRGFHTVALDQRGQYETPGPDDPAAYTRDALVDDLLAVADTVAPGERIHLVGHSFGGLVCRSVALRVPERLASLTLMSTGPAAISPDETTRLLLLEEVLPLLTRQEVWEAMQAVEIEAGLLPPTDPVIAEFLHGRWLGNTPAGLLGMAEQLRTEPDRVAELAAVVAAGLPALVISGVEDYAWPLPWQADMATRLGVRHLVIPDAFHSPNVESPATTAAALAEFWTTTPKTTTTTDATANVSADRV
ncbi:alpha/beta fold hydrolase [Embleya sp. NBC_00896]|uniref:alpha/beta fold hydrolase n=1 Tax=Embleya sp. NBC_00896 TaxID=2975961 RepID=UPI0038643C32|nr:alpha/beta hydrolase [Embleya sp. NBC_00896]